MNHLNPTDVANELIRAVWEDQEAPFDYDESIHSQPSAPQELIDAVKLALDHGWIPTKFNYTHPDDKDCPAEQVFEPNHEFEIGDIILIPVEDWITVQPTLSQEDAENIENVFNEWYEAHSEAMYKAEQESNQ
jgi:hypothetical protein